MNTTIKTLYNKLKEQLDSISKIISGGARGRLKDNNIETEIFLPDWKKYGKSAGISDMVIAFWDGNQMGIIKCK